MELTINGCRLNVEDLGPRDAPVIIAHHGGGGIGSLEEPKSTFGPLADDPRWTESSLDPEPAVGVWSDDFHNLLSVFKW